MVGKEKNTKGLGRGIGALFSSNPLDEIEAIDLTHEKVEEIALSQIRPNPYQPRKVFDDSALQELSESIKQTGVFQPIILRKSAIKGYEIVAGERRVRASKLAGKETIPAIVRELDETLMIEIAVIENLQREDLNPLEEAQAYQMLMHKLSLTQIQVAERLGKSRPYIANYLRLLGLPDVVKQHLANGELSMGQARTLLSLESEKDMVELCQKVLKQGMTVRQLEEAVQQKLQKTAENIVYKVKNKRPFYVVESEERLTDKFGTSVHIVDKGDKGKIEIEYMSKDDLGRILEILNIEFD